MILGHAIFAGVPIRNFKRISEGPDLTTDFIMHHKFCLIDDASLEHGLFIGGSLNWTMKVSASANIIKI